MGNCMFPNKMMPIPVDREWHWRSLFAVYSWGN